MRDGDAGASESRRPDFLAPPEPRTRQLPGLRIQNNQLVSRLSMYIQICLVTVAMNRSPNQQRDVGTSSRGTYLRTPLITND